MADSVLLTIGMPVYNGERYIKEAIDSVLSQGFQSFRLIISDNASTDSTASIVKAYQNSDSRVEYFCHDKNMGAVANFLFVASNISTPYFMWFSCDDFMGAGFLQTCIDKLNFNSKLGMAFTMFCNVDSIGREIRKYSHLAELSGKVSNQTIAMYLLLPEILGKANLIHSVYRKSVISTVIKDYGFPHSWGGDMSFVYAALLKGGIQIDSNVMFYKRLVRECDATDTPKIVEVSQGVLNQSCPIECFPEYERATIDAARGTRFLFLTAFLMRYRYLRLLCLRKNQEQGSEKSTSFSASGQWVKDTYFSIEFAFKVLLK